METFNVVAEPTTLQELTDAMPLVWTALLGVVVGVGLLLWCLGSRLTRSALMVSGFVAGGLCAAALASMALGGDVETNAENGRATLWVVAIAVGGGIAGLLLASLLFRVWVALMTGVICAAVVPLGMLVAQGNGPSLSAVRDGQAVALEALGAGESDPEASELRQSLHAERAQIDAYNSDGASTPDEADAGNNGEPPSATDEEVVRSLFDPASAQDADALPSERDTEVDDPAANGLPSLEQINPIRLTQKLIDWPRLRDDLAGVASAQVQQVREWWDQLPGEDKRALLAGMCVGGVVGLVLGFALPYLLASLQSALVGAVLIVFAGRLLLLQYVPDAASVLPRSGRGILLTVGLITLLGVLVQWTLRGKKADD